MVRLQDSGLQYGNRPVIRIWSSVLWRPYFCTARWPILNPSPYTGEVSDSIWCLKNSPSFLSNGDLTPCFDARKAEDEATLLPEPVWSCVSNHIYARTWQMPSSTSWLRCWKPCRNKEYLSISRKRHQMHPLQRNYWVFLSINFMQIAIAGKDHHHRNKTDATIWNYVVNFKKEKQTDFIHRRRRKFTFKSHPCMHHLMSQDWPGKQPAWNPHIKYQNW